MPSQALTEWFTTRSEKNRGRQEKKAPRFKVGDRVRFPLGNGKVYGKIKEDSGLLGRGGRRLYEVYACMDPDEPEIFLMPEEELEPDLESENGKIVIDKAEIKDFLKWGGLVDCS